MLVPPSATRSAKQATTIAGDGRPKSFRIVFPFPVALGQATRATGRLRRRGRGFYASLTETKIDSKYSPARRPVRMCCSASEMSPLAESFDLGRELLTGTLIDAEQPLVSAVPAEEVPELPSHLHFVLEVEEREGVAVPV